MEQSPPLSPRPRLLLQGKRLGFWPSPIEAIILVAVVAAGAFIGFNFYARSTDLNAVPAAPPTFLPAFRTTLTSTVSATGSVQSSQQVTLTFGSTGKIKEFLVPLGAQVTAGQALARIDDADLAQLVRSSETSLASSEARYQAATAGPTTIDVTSAQQSIASANSSLITAQQNLTDLRLKPTPADISAGQQSVLSAQNSVQSANDAVTKAQNDITSAQNGVTTARNGVTTARNGVTTARNSVTTARNNLTQAQNDLNLADDNMAVAYDTLDVVQEDLQLADNACNGPSYSVPSMPSEGSLARTALPLLSSYTCNAMPATPTAADRLTAFTSAISKYNSSAGSYNSSVSTVTTRQNSVTTARTSVTTAENGVTTAENGVTKAETDVTTAEQAVVTAQNNLNNGNLQRAIQNAQLGVSQAQQKYQETLAGPKQSELDAAQRTIDSASASLLSAQARYDALFDPPGRETLLPLQATIDEARSNLETARKNLAAATIVAPFDGQISQITGEVGTQVSATTAVFILLNPRLIRIDANVDQAFVTQLRTGQTANVTFDALQGRTYQATVGAIGLTPTTQQGVVTYVATFAMDTSRLPQGAPTPAPGMTASIRVTTTSTANALVVPSRAVRRIGQNQTVQVKTDNDVEQRTVTTGVSNGTLIQITNGLEDGEEVLVTVTAAAPTGAGGGQQGGGGAGGGGGGGQFVPGGGGGGGGGGTP